MTPHERDPKACLTDIVESCEAIESATRDLDLEVYLKNRLVRSAVEREFIIIGVALAALSRSAPQVFASIAHAHRLVDLGKQLTHGYPSLDDTIVWAMADRDVPILHAECHTRLHKDTAMSSVARKSGKPILAKNLSLGRVLNQTEEIKENVEEAAGNLSSVNEILKQDQDVAHPAQAIENAIAQNEAVENQVAKAADDLEQVNADLATEVTERIGLESELADMKIDLAEVRDDLSQSRANEEEARQRAFKDALTGLPNRTLFKERLDHGLIQAKRHGWKLGVMFIDINHFKRINDSYGHDLGDDVLLMVANRLQALVRAEDTVSRWGGDEFVCILLTTQQKADMAHLAEQMVRRIAEACEFGETVLSISVSIGVTLYPKDGETADVLFRNADEAMYKAKRTENGISLFR